MTKNVGLFFYVNGEFLFHSCSLEDAEEYGNFLIYPQSHMEIWDENYIWEYGVDFDYFPRGRINYRKTDGTFLVYCDRCIGDEILPFADKYCGKLIYLDYDERYQCHKCNRNYMV